ERTVEEVLSILPVEIPGLDKPFISNCIDEFMKEEVLIDEDRSGQFCVGCSENTPHGRRYEFSKDSLPDNICVQVKRFVQNDNGPRKITKDIINNNSQQIINYYLNLLENDRTKSLDVFFYSTLKKSKAIAVDRLIKAEVMNFDMIFVPINVSNHWILCTIDTTSKTIQWYDSYLSLTSLTTKHKNMDLIRDAVNEAVSPGEIQWKTSVIQVEKKWFPKQIKNQYGVDDTSESKILSIMTSCSSYFSVQYCCVNKRKGTLNAHKLYMLQSFHHHDKL
ncbi:Hypothetical predicted protein, partial [Mytilus galloprovincialis]